MKKNILYVLFVFPFFTTQAQYSWTQKANFTGTARAYDVGFSIGNYAFIGAGENGNSYYKDFYKWSAATNSWSAIANYPGVGSYEPIAMTIEGKGYVGLGWTGSNAATDLWQYDTATNSWTAMASFPGQARYGAGVFVVGHKAYVVGGSPGGPPYFDEVWMYDAHQNSWTQMSNSPAGTVEGMGGFTIGNHGYIGGGWNNSNYLNGFWEYDTTNDTWAAIASIPLSGGLGGTTRGFVIGSKAYFCTGSTIPNPTTISDGYVYDTVTKTWSVFTNMGAHGIERDYAVALTIAGNGYIGTGFDSTGGLLNDFWEYGTSTGIEEIQTSANISLFPNPSNGIINFTYSGNNQKGELQITDLMGRILTSYEMIGSEGQITLNETSLSSGMYFYRVINSGAAITSGKFIIAK